MDTSKQIYFVFYLIAIEIKKNFVCRRQLSRTFDICKMESTREIHREFA